MAQAPVRTAAPPLSGKPLPFSECVRVGDLLFISGQIGHRPGSRELAPGGVAAETKQAMDNLGAVLARQGATFEDVVKVVVMMADMSEWETMNAVYVQYFAPDALPARSAFGAASLALGARLELEAIAMAPRKP